MKRRGRAKLLIALFASLLLLFSAGCGEVAEGQPPLQGEVPPEGAEGLSRSTTTHDELIATIREAYRSHSAAITLTFVRSENIENELPELIASWIDEAMEDTGRGDEGDYLRYQNGGYTLNTKSTESEGNYRYSVTIRPKYYTYLSQEEAVTEKEAEILTSLGLSSQAGDFDKTRAVYDYLCGEVKYDSVHEGNPHHTIRSTAYGALVRGSATCMGYATAMYRLLKDMGVDCSVVRGKAVNDLGEEKEHAWNSVSVDGEVYYLDATWDAGREEYRYFIKSANSFPSHEASP